jgi:hypothetical protein
VILITTHAGDARTWENFNQRFPARLDLWAGPGFAEERLPGISNKGKPHGPDVV